MSYRQFRIIEQLETITIGRTTTLHGQVVTRWSADAYEIGTLGRNRISGEQTSARLLEGAN